MTTSAEQYIEAHDQNVAGDRGFAGTPLKIRLRPLGGDLTDPIAVRDGNLTIGRKLSPFDELPEEDILGLSRNHARIFEQYGIAYVEDLGSLNGTFLNHQKIGSDPVAMASGDELDVGGVFRFEVEVEQQPVADHTVLQQPALVELQLVPANGAQLETLEINRFPFLLSRNSDVFSATRQRDPEVVKHLSRKHALITLSGEQLFIEDLDSANGTFIQGSRVEHQALPLNHGDRLSLGDASFSYDVNIRLLDDDRTIIAHSAARSVSPPCEGGVRHALDFHRLRAAGLIVPGHQNPNRVKEFRRVKRRLLSNVEWPDARTKELPGSSILVTSALSKEGKTFVAINLALSLAAEHDCHVLLVDADPENRDLSRLLDVEDQPGLVDALNGTQDDAESRIVRTNIDGLKVLPAGKPTDNLDELFASERMTDLLLGLGRSPRQVILFDGPALIPGTESQVLAHAMAQTLVVVEAGKTPRHALEESVDLLAGASGISLLLNKAPRENAFSRFVGV